VGSETVRPEDIGVEGKMKYTPGPWAIAHSGNNIEIGLRNVEWNPNIIGMVVAKTIGNSKVCEANAALIAAAPDLLEALKECCEWIRKHSPADDWPFCLDGARMAIRKAEDA